MKKSIFTPAMKKKKRGNKMDQKKEFEKALRNFINTIGESISTDDGQWTIIGSINYIPDILNENGMFSELGEEWFDDYWINYKRITVKGKDGNIKKISSLEECIKYKKGDVSKIVKRKSVKKNRKLYE